MKDFEITDFWCRKMGFTDGMEEDKKTPMAELFEKLARFCIENKIENDFNVVAFPILRIAFNEQRYENYDMSLLYDIYDTFYQPLLKLFTDNSEKFNMKDPQAEVVSILAIFYKNITKNKNSAK